MTCALRARRHDLAGLPSLPNDRVDLPIYLADALLVIPIQSDSGMRGSNLMTYLD